MFQVNVSIGFNPEALGILSQLVGLLNPAAAAVETPKASKSKQQAAIAPPVVEVPKPVVEVAATAPAAEAEAEEQELAQMPAPAAPVVVKLEDVRKVFAEKKDKHRAALNALLDEVVGKKDARLTDVDKKDYAVLLEKANAL